EEAQQHVLQGLNHLHGGWEFEAARHFACAMQKDPDCLMAHWGLVMSLLDASPEYAEARKAAVDRLLYLTDLNQASELEMGYAYGLIQYLSKGPNAAAIALRKVAERFPNDMQAAMLAALFSRGGYDVTGVATPDQLASERQLLALMERFPDSTLPINALLVLRAEAPDVGATLELARKLCQMDPGYAPAFHTLGHYEWRCGNPGRAVTAFSRCTTLYQNWMRQGGITVADCPELVKAQSYRVVALLSMGDYDTACAAARQVAATPLPQKRIESAGARALLWEAGTLPARILIHRGLKEERIEASRSLPSTDQVKATVKLSCAYLWIDGLRIALEAQQAIDKQQLDKARLAAQALEQHIAMMDGTEKHAIILGERSEWLRANRALKVLLGDLRGWIASAGPADLRGTAYNWYASALEHQRRESMFHPPMLLTPMAARIGRQLLGEGRHEEAIARYREALRMFPGDVESLTGLRDALIAANKTDEAAAIGLQIEQLKTP
ncbi:MAG TPA: tetratricopeptide repeat protein, partial [Luteolibacter sp.]|nr:tetratricopeptide repeat protein [Luteolibacter sp.]